VVAWLASPDSDRVNERRFIAEFWDASVNPVEPAAKCGARDRVEGEPAIADRSK